MLVTRHAKDVLYCHLQAPDAAAIRTAITDEARQRGLEHTLRDERPPAPPQRRNLVLPPELLGPVDGQLLQLLEQALADAGGNILQELRLSGSGVGSQGQQQQEEAEEEVSRTTGCQVLRREVLCSSCWVSFDSMCARPDDCSRYITAELISIACQAQHG